MRDNVKIYLSEWLWKGCTDVSFVTEKTDERQDCPSGQI
jgi:hypothetical protein